MAMHHAQPGEVIDVNPLGNSLDSTKTCSLFKTERMEVLRMVLPAGKSIAEHKAPGEITIQCVEGRVAFTTMGKSVELTAGKMLHLSAAEKHALHAIEASSLLVFILL